jgi:hypothetical protein
MTIRASRSSFDVSRFLQFTGGVSATRGATVAPAPGLTLAQVREICTAAISLCQQSCVASAIYQVRDTIARSRPDGFVDPVSDVTDPDLDPAGHPWLHDTFPVAGAALPMTWKWGSGAADRRVSTCRLSNKGSANSSIESARTSAREQCGKPGGNRKQAQRHVSRVGLGSPLKKEGSYPMRGSKVMPIPDKPTLRRCTIKGKYVGYVTSYDPLNDFLSRITRDLIGVREPHPAFRAFRLVGSNEVYAYEEKFSGTKIVCKFYGPKFASKPGLAAEAAQREHDNLNMLRGYNLIGSPHHVIQPFGVCPDINSVLAVEYFTGEELVQAIERAAYHCDDAYLFSRLTALAYFLATQHNRTANGAAVDFGPICAYFDRIIDKLRSRGRIGQWDVEEFSWLSGIWNARDRMWEDRQVRLHGDATPANFLFNSGMDVAAIDLERSMCGDRVFDVGRIAGELQHAFMVRTGHKHRAEPFIGHFLWEYCCHLSDRDCTFKRVTARVPYYMGLTLLRIARNNYITNDYCRRLIRQAKRLLRAP